MLDCKLWQDDASCLRRSQGRQKSLVAQKRQICLSGGGKRRYGGDQTIPAANDLTTDPRRQIIDAKGVDGLLEEPRIGHRIPLIAAAGPAASCG